MTSEQLEHRLELERELEMQTQKYHEDKQKLRRDYVEVMMMIGRELDELNQEIVRTEYNQTVAAFKEATKNL